MIIEVKKSLSFASGSKSLNIRSEIPERKVTAFFGPSGSGKTSLLKMIAGLMRPDQGKIKAEGNLWFDSERKFTLAPGKRDLAIVFQQDALFANMNVLEYLNFCKSKNSTEEEVEEILISLNLNDFKNRKSTSLSGGQRKKVMLAGALLSKPMLLLLDEPFASVDKDSKELMIAVIRKYRNVSQSTTILVTHEMSDVFRLTDHVICLDQGEVKSAGTPESVFADNKLSGKFRVVGEIVKMEKQGFMYKVVIASEKELITVLLDESDGLHIQIGDQVMAVSKAFNPMIIKID